MPSGYRIVPNPNLEQELEAHVSRGLQEAALAAAAELERRISKGPRRGRHYRDAKHPRRSSAPGEYPQEQLGELKASLYSQEASPLEFEVGFAGDQELQDKVMYLEYFGEHGTGSGVRRPMFMLFAGKDSKRTMRLMRAAAQKVMQ